ncbi:acylneuraminate cytidylyltransferase family protein [Roseibium sp.]|uniref:acylneuraminate cytidylyltransferase family protein n=1 Tax=Roseibium sp. TaxID=1936156 RepID=UPI003D115F5C
MKKAVAIIPARGGSKGIPHKNIKAFLGLPLVVHSIKAAFAAKTISNVVVSSDDEEILQIAQAHGAIPLKRPGEIAGDEASSEAALIHAISSVPACSEADTVVFLQCTSPLTTADEIDHVVSAFRETGADTAFSVVEKHAFLWGISEDGSGFGINHDASKPRQRRQDRVPEYQETGAIYALKKDGFVQYGQRFFGKSVPVPIDGAVEIEIDTPRDWATLEAYARASQN